MAILAGVDEAGLGPRLGPLVLGLTVFEGPAERLGDLARCLEPLVGSRAKAAVPVGDSKRLYGPRKDLAVLERGLFPFLLQCRAAPPADLSEWVRFLDLPGSRTGENLSRYPWYREKLPLPRAASPETLRAGAEDLAGVLARSGIRFREIRVSVLHAGEVNQGLGRYASKNIFNFFAAAPLIRRVFEAYGTLDGVDLVVDRQGGRKDYAGLLRALFHPAAVTPRPAPEGTFAYQVQDDTRRMGLRFVTRADSAFLPVGLASMAAKYTRELHMELFNRFWRGLQPELKPTAGYPLDAGRFLEDIQDLRGAVGVGEDRLIRAR